MRKAAELPFRVDRNLRTNLVDQVVDGFHQAIRSGIYRPGDTIPTVRALAPQLGVSVRVTAEAVKALAAKGLVAPRPRLGSVVLPRNATLWNGTVVLILPDGYGYSQTEMSSRVRQALVGAGYLCMQTIVPGKVCGGRKLGRYDVSSLEFMLSRHVDFAVLMFDCKAAANLLRRRGVPYVSVGFGDCPSAGSVGHVSFDYDVAMSDLTEACKAAGVRTAVQVCKGGGEYSAVAALSAAGVSVLRKVVSLRQSEKQGRLWDIQQATFDLFKSWTVEPSFAWPDLMYITDDYLASAALLALEHLRIDIPRQVRVVVMSNKGYGPVAWNSLARIENDPCSYGETIASGVLSFLSGEGFPTGLRLEAKYVPGDSFSM